MPLYDYVCAKCDQSSERYVAHGDDRPLACDGCSETLERSSVAAFSVRTPAANGARMADGSFVKGTWGPPPRRVPRRIKTFA